MTNYSDGRRREYKARDALKAMGFEVPVRAAGSKGPADLVAVKDKMTYFVQVKTAKEHMVEAARVWLWEVASEGGGIPLVAVVERRKPVQFYKVDFFYDLVEWPVEVELEAA